MCGLYELADVAMANEVLHSVMVNVSLGVKSQPLYPAMSATFSASDPVRSFSPLDCQSFKISVFKFIFCFQCVWEHSASRHDSGSANIIWCGQRNIRTRS